MTYYANRPSQLAYSNDTAATESNTGGAAGSDLGAVGIINGGTITYQSGSWRFRRGATSSVARFQKTVDTSVRYSVEATLELPSAITTESRVIMFMTSTGGYAAILTITGSGFLRIYNAANQAVYTATTPVPIAKFRVHIGAEISTDGTDGKVRLSAFLGANNRGTTPDFTFSSDAVNTGTDLITSIRTGHSNNMDGNHDLLLSDWQADSTKITGLGPLQGGSPTATVQSGAQSYALVDARNSIAGGGTLSYSIAPTGNTQVLAPGLWAVERTTQDQSFTVTVADSISGLTDTQEVTISPSLSSIEGYTQTLIKIGGVWQ